MTFAAPSEASFLTLLKKLQGVGGYAEDDDSQRVLELSVAANIAADGSTTILNAANQAWPATADQLLFAIEIVHSLRNSAARSVAQRRTRLEAVLRGDARFSKIKDALAHAGLDASNIAVIQNLRQHISESVGLLLPTREELPDESIFQIAILISDSDYDDGRLYRTALDILDQILPGRSRSHMGETTGDGVLATSHGIRWGSSDRLDRSVLFKTPMPLSIGTFGDNESALLPGRRTDIGYARKLRLRHPSRLKPFGPLSKLRSHDLNALQDNLLFGIANQSSAALPFGPGVGGEWRIVSMQTAFGNKIVDSVVNWSDRFVTFVGRISALDIRLSGANKTALNNGAPVIQTFGYTGLGQTNGVGPNYDIPIDGSAHFYSDAVSASHQLSIHDSTPGTRYIVGILIATPRLGAHAPSNTTFPSLNPLASLTHPHRITSFDKEDHPPTVAWFNAVRDHSFFKNANNTNIGDGFAPGGVRRVGCAVNLKRPASGSFTIVLDSTVDWRDRALLVSYRIQNGNYNAVFPRIPGGRFDNFSADQRLVFGYTGPGEQWQIPFTGTQYKIGLVQASAVPHLTLFAAIDTGELVAEIDSSYPTDWVTVMLDVHGTEQMNIIGLTSVAPAPIPNSGDGEQILAFDLNALQDGSISTQMRSGDPTMQNKHGTHFNSPSDMPLPAWSSSWPMGPIGERPTTENRTGPSVSEGDMDPTNLGTPESSQLKLGNAIVPLRRKIGPLFPSVLMTGIERNQQAVPGSRVPDLLGRARSMQRQNVAGGVRIYFGRTLLAGVVTVIDDSVDWRDRIITVVTASLANGNQYPGGAGEAGIGADTHLFVCGYTGEGQSHRSLIGSNLVEVFADEYQVGTTLLPKRGRLCMISPNVDSFMVGMIWASFQLGCSQKAEQRRNFSG